MRILIISAAGRLGRAVAAELGGDHELRLLDSGSAAPPAGVQAVDCSLLDRDALAGAVDGIEAVVHTGEPPADASAGALLLDWATRGTHNLFSAAIAAGATRFVYGGTLQLFDDYPEEVYISELHKPLPTPDMAVMSRYLGELTCREFTRDHMITVTALRLGRLVVEEELEGQPPDPVWLDVRDAALAFRCALGRDASENTNWSRRWALYHICAPIPNPRFLIGSARSQLGYEPAHGFGAAREREAT